MIWATVNCAETHRARYEVNVADGSDVKTIRAASDVTLDKPIEFEFANYTISLTFTIDPTLSDEYSLTVSLASSTSSASSLRIPIITQSFRSKLVGRDNGPLEFRIEENGINVFGAVALSSIHQ